MAFFLFCLLLPCCYPGRGELTSEYSNSVNWVRVRVPVRVRVRLRVRVRVSVGVGVRVRVRVRVRVMRVRVGVRVRVMVRVRPLVRKRATLLREALESVSLCTRFSGFSTISSSSFNRLS